MCILCIWCVLAAPGQQNKDLDQMLSRVAEQAEVFLRVAPQVLSEEKLQQKALKTARHPRIRVGAAAIKAEEKFDTREIVSEYGYSSFQDSPQAIHEFRQVLAVDGRKLAAAEKVNKEFASTVHSQSDAAKKRLLEDFEKHGLHGAVTDFGQVILLFRKRQIQNLRFELTGEARIGVDETEIYSFRESSATQWVTVFEGKKILREPLAGNLWVRKSDFLPLRIRLTTVQEDGNYVLKNEATVDYSPTSHGVILPVSVMHRQYKADRLIAENLFQYTAFRKFSADSEIKFGEPPQ
jgi:hypothetical protein